MVANKYAFLQITRRRFLNEWEAFKKVISRRNIRRRITIPLTLDRKSGSAGMPRPISYAVFCLKKKKITREPKPISVPLVVSWLDRSEKTSLEFSPDEDVS